MNRADKTTQALTHRHPLVADPAWTSHGLEFQAFRCRILSGFWFVRNMTKVIVADLLSDTAGKAWVLRSTPWTQLLNKQSIAFVMIASLPVTAR